jgi:GR25 family glycosyltransferase involved in LPS biosynthesis
MIYVINLERRPERLKEIIGELKREGLDRSFTLIRAIDGRKLPEPSVLIRMGILSKELSGSQWVASHPGAIGNYLSHMEVCRRILSSDDDVNLVLEDDAQLIQGFGKELQRILKMFKEKSFDLLYLGISNISHRRGTGHWKQMEDRIFYPDPADGEVFGTFAMLMNKKAARVFLEGATPMTQATDSRMSSFVTGLRRTALDPERILYVEKKLKGGVMLPPLARSRPGSLSDTSS